MTGTQLRTEDFDYHLPEELIAQEPMMPRDACRLLVMNRDTSQLDHRHFRDIGDYLEPGDLLVVNETRVLPARLQGRRADTGGAVEVLLLKELDKATNTWECLVKPGKRVREGAIIEFADSAVDSIGVALEKQDEGRSKSLQPASLLTGVVEAVDEGGIRRISFTAADNDFHAVIHQLGTLPLPPYIKDYAGDQSMYQTVYASTDEHSAAAPTAGLHFTPELLEQLQSRGINVARVRLDVGLDTFRPVSEDDPAQHHIHTEYFHVSQQAADAVNATRAAGGRVVAVGTTVVRALESAAQLSADSFLSEQGAPTSLYILPGFDFQVVDALITNFHVPKSTLVMMISAFTGREEILAAYKEAVHKEYRFLSFGDAMLIL
ncbi:MAG: tRNA preQ1(34) S-adenosylmethionine ribosyltransferase-isomerase QueA [Coriobacteriia bacterium]|nr:tRNA preQ1(34) S-adenosylmethionine ribosyltransferase-isomerase QueA [Coriobacteriia bacterium]MCL2745833.1 tRNA preQ1(34) S-adenosylmethionine ribosyltransferase-isomerase QueA [Coriobacteriia bacterium]MCL2870547.1 tRNA preQ1(34) S-adenosylmethionine ribosyltransferase-isomerase QueA [Coriobacteriia bacterium]